MSRRHHAQYGTGPPDEPGPAAAGPSGNGRTGPPAAVRVLCVLSLLLSGCSTAAVPAASPPAAITGPGMAPGTANGRAALETPARVTTSAGASAGTVTSIRRQDDVEAGPQATADDVEGGPGLAAGSDTTSMSAGPASAGGSEPGAVPAGSMSPTRDVPAPPAAAVVKPKPFALDLYRRGDFVRQYTFDWCVGASIQMMLNMIRPSNETSQARQQEIWEIARDLSSSPYRGANPRGWAGALNQLGAGTYALVAVKDYGEALRAAATAIRDTHRPVGLVMWGGRHAWVMSGFTSSGDPRTTPGFVVTGVRVLDPLYPYGSSQWGASPAADTLLRPGQLDDQFVPRHHRRPPPDGRPDYAPEGSYVLVLPES